MTFSNLLRIIFIITAIINIVVSIKKEKETGISQYSAIAGWTCAIIYCII